MSRQFGFSAAFCSFCFWHSMPAFDAFKGADHFYNVAFVVAGHKTSVSLEEAFWNGMKEISGERSMTLSELVGEIDTKRQQGNLSSAIRLFVLDYFKSRAAGSSGEPKLRASWSGRSLAESSPESG
jgi:predicted DNA-binding ribbon-helix-helix protein